MISIRTSTLAVLVALAGSAACDKTKILPGRCEKPSDCQGGLTCDDNRTCVPPSGGQPPCNNDLECGDNYFCDNLHWCVCVVPFQNGSDDPCTNGTLPTYRGVQTDGGIDTGGDGGDGSDGGDGGFKCQGAGDCSPPKPTCAPSGQCVECVVSTDCASPEKPICDTNSNTCVPCTTDAECVMKLGQDPGVCMFHQDGRCATAGEVVYVKNSNTCPSANDPNAGLISAPFCSVANAIAAASNRRLIVVRGGNIPAGVTVQSMPTMSIVGQAGAALSADSGQFGLRVMGTDLYVRSLAIAKLSTATGTGVGIAADSGSTLRLDRVLIDGMAGGGILLDGAAFEIKNTKVTGNGPAIDGTTSWGGILVKALPARRVSG